MAYKSYVCRSGINVNTFIQDLENWFNEAGYTLVDSDGDYSSGYKVYTNNGSENGEYLPFYVIISYGSAKQFGTIGDTCDANKVYINPCRYWDKTRKEPYGIIGYASSVNVTSSAGYFWWIYGSRNNLFVITKVDTSYSGLTYFYPDTLAINANAKVTTAINAGINVWVEVDNVADFYRINEPVNIIKADLSGSFSAKLLDIDITNNKLLLSHIPDLEIGDMIGFHPCPLIKSNSKLLAQGYKSEDYLNLLYGMYSSLSTNSKEIGDIQNQFIKDIAPAYFLDQHQLDPDFYTNKYAFSPIILNLIALNGKKVTELIGYMNDFIMFSTSNPGDEALMTSDALVDSYATGGTSNTLVDTNQSFDNYTDYYIVIYAGKGYGQTRKIQSNTSDTITVYKDWDEVPDSTSKYQIVKYVYRNFTFPEQDIVIKESVE